jgi:hypothetical protein
MIPQPHEIITHSENKYECRICAQTWIMRPLANCPGLKVYPKDDHAPLMSKGQLSANGYRTSEKFLPPPSGCYLAGASENYVMLYDPNQAAKRLNRSRPMTAHDLVKYGAGHFECRVCFNTWTKRPQTACPGLRVYGRYDHDPLMTQNELARMGYHATPKRLPPEAGCFYKESASRYMPLYDPIQATPKTHLRDVHNTITEILWPISCLSLLATLSDMQPLRKLSAVEQGRAQELLREIANIAALTGIYTRAELEQIAGGVIVFTLPPTILYRFYPTARMNFVEEFKLQTNLIIAYRKYITVPQSLS